MTLKITKPREMCLLLLTEIGKSTQNIYTEGNLMSIHRANQSAHFFLKKLSDSCVSLLSRNSPGLSANVSGDLM
jgi:hypothetical protein